MLETYSLSDTGRAVLLSLPFLYGVHHGIWNNLTAGSSKSVILFLVTFMESDVFGLLIYAPSVLISICFPLYFILGGIVCCESSN